MADQHAGQRGNGAHQHERGAPAPVLSQPGGQRHAQQRGQRQPRHHQAHGARAPVGRGQRRGHQCRDAEVRAVRQARHQAQQVHREVAGRHRAGEVARGEQRHQGHQQRAPRPVGGQHGQHRRAHHHAQRVGGDHVAGLGNGDLEILRDLGQQAHDHELAGADGEAADPQGPHGGPEVPFALRGLGRGRGGDEGGRDGGHGRLAAETVPLIVLRCSKPCSPGASAPRIRRFIMRTMAAARRLLLQPFPTGVPHGR